MTSVGLACEAEKVRSVSIAAVTSLAQETSTAERLYLKPVSEVPSLTVLNTTTSLVLRSTLLGVSHRDVRVRARVRPHPRGPDRSSPDQGRTATRGLSSSTSATRRWTPTTGPPSATTSRSLPPGSMRSAACSAGRCGCRGTTAGNRTFFFASYDGLRLKQPQTVSVVVPSLARGPRPRV